MAFLPVLCVADASAYMPPPNPLAQILTDVPPPPAAPPVDPWCPDLDFLVALQAFLTVVGNCTCWIAAYRIYTAAQAEQPSA